MSRSSAPLLNEKVFRSRQIHKWWLISDFFFGIWYILISTWRNKNNILDILKEHFLIFTNRVKIMRVKLIGKVDFHWTPSRHLWKYTFWMNFTRIIFTLLLKIEKYSFNVSKMLLLLHQLLIKIYRMSQKIRNRSSSQNLQLRKTFSFKSGA